MGLAEVVRSPGTFQEAFHQAIDEWKAYAKSQSHQSGLKNEHPAYQTLVALGRLNDGMFFHLLKVEILKEPFVAGAGWANLLCDITGEPSEIPDEIVRVASAAVPLGYVLGWIERHNKGWTYCVPGNTSVLH